ncbi:hypothetical protein [Streptomyces sp. GESEQ-35]|uniref:hypothetical protein n=1 Tax=Streptomyces sp. GESEQ-35 TaxID=2812657 RepID=UPI001B333DC9|nr:hypothetical protein [Streptomyces sp. GESEQ-35]
MGTAAVLAFVTVFFGWLPNPFAEEPSPSPVKRPALEVLSRQFPEPARIPAEFKEGKSFRAGTTLATRLAFTLRNRGDLKAAITEFRFTVRREKALYGGTGPGGCLPNTGGDTEITANYDVDFSELTERGAPVTAVVKGAYDLAAGEVERVLFTIGGIESYDASLYLVDVEFREGAEKELIPAGTVAFLGPVDKAPDYLDWIHAVAPSDLTPCDDDLIRDVDRSLALADDHSPQVEGLKEDLEVLERRLNGGG